MGATSWKRVPPEIGHRPNLKHTRYEKNFNVGKSGLDSGGGALVGRFSGALVEQRGRVLNFRRDLNFRLPSFCFSAPGP